MDPLTGSSPTSDAVPFDHLEVERRGRVAVVRLSRPPVNALNNELYAEVLAFFTSPHAYVDGCRVVVLGSRGPHFCAGLDRDEARRLATGDQLADSSRLGRHAFLSIQQCPLPVVGAVSGAVLGGGLAIASMCDVLVASDDAQFGLPEIKLGVSGGASFARRLVPPHMLRHMVLSGEPVSANDLCRLGAVHSVVSSEDVIEAALMVAETLAAHPATSLRMAKEALNFVEEATVDRGYEYEQGMTALMMSTAEGRRSVEGFSEGP